MLVTRLRGVCATALALGSTLALRPATLAAQTEALRVDSIFAFVKDTTPGCAVAAVREGAVLYAKGYGVADFEHSIPITPESVFYLASVSKQFTAAAINLLVLDHKLSPADEVRKYVPELPQYDQPITIAHLLHHTSGVRDYLELFGLAGLNDFPITNADFLAMLGRQRALNFRPGQFYSYSNSNYVLLGIVVERVTGKPLRVFAQERIFGPLGMTATVFRDQHDMLIPRRALAYRRLSNGPWVASVPHFDTIGDGGLFSSVLDLAKWEGNFWQPTVGGADWLGLTNERGKLNDGRTIGYGAGLIHGTYRGDSTVSHGGGYGGYNTSLLRFPRWHFSVAVLCNSRSAPGSELSQRVADVFLADVLAPVAAASGSSSASPPMAPIALDSVRLASHTGTFFNEDQVLVRRVVVDSGKLYYSRGPGNRSQLAPIGERRFQMVGATLRVIFSEDGGRLQVESDGDPPVVLRRMPAARALNLGPYGGSYFSGELPATYTVEVRDSSLLVRGERGFSNTVTPVFEDGFSSGFLFVQFRRGDGGQVIGLELSAGDRVRRLRFEKRP